MSRLAWPLWLVTAIVAAGQHDVPDFDSNFDAGGGIGSSHGELAAQQQEAFETLHTKLEKLARAAAPSSREREGEDEVEGDGGGSRKEDASEWFWGETEAINLQLALSTRSPEEASSYGSWSSNWAMR